MRKTSSFARVSLNAFLIGSLVAANDAPLMENYENGNQNVVLEENSDRAPLEENYNVRSPEEMNNFLMPPVLAFLNSYGNAYNEYNNLLSRIDELRAEVNTLDGVLAGLKNKISDLREEEWDLDRKLDYQAYRFDVLRVHEGLRDAELQLLDCEILEKEKELNDLMAFCVENEEKNKVNSINASLGRISDLSADRLSASSCDVIMHSYGPTFNVAVKGNQKVPPNTLYSLCHAFDNYCKLNNVKMGYLMKCVRGSGDHLDFARKFGNLYPNLIQVPESIPQTHVKSKVKSTNQLNTITPGKNRQTPNFARNRENNSGGKMQTPKSARQTPSKSINKGETGFAASTPIKNRHPQYTPQSQKRKCDQDKAGESSAKKQNATPYTPRSKPQNLGPTKEVYISQTLTAVTADNVYTGFNIRTYSMTPLGV